MSKIFSKKEVWLPILVLVVVGGFAYSFNLNNGLFWDDDDWIINNNSVHAISWDNVKFWFTQNTLAGVGLKSNYYRPFLFFTFALNYIADGVKPLVWHLTSNLLHIANGVLIFFLIKRFDLGSRTIASGELRDRSVKRSNLVAFLTAFIFTIHPLQTEAVTYISGRGDLLVVFFMLLALWFFIKSHFGESKGPTPEVEPPLGGSTSKYRKMFGSSTSKHWVWMAGSLFSLILALLSRETAIVFPLLLVVFYIAFSPFPRFDLGIANGRNFIKSARRCFVKTWPYFAVVIIYGILRLTVLNFQNTLNFYQQANIYSENLYVRIFTFMHVLAEYVRLLIWPAGLHMERSMIIHASFFQWPVWGVFAVLAGLVIWLVFLYKKEQHFGSLNSKSQPQNPKQITNSQISNLTPNTYNLAPFKVWFFGVGWFFIALVPVSGITPINAILYEHWLYLPMVGFWFIAAFYLTKLLNFQGSTHAPESHGCKPVGEWLSVRGSAPRNPVCQEATAVKPWSFTFLKIQGRTLVIIALAGYFSFFAYQSIQRNILWGKPIEFYQDILKYEPDSMRINNNLGNLYYNQGDTDRAQEFYQKAADSEDVFPQPHYNIGSILQSRGDISGAIEEYKKATEIDPNFFYPYQNLAVIYAQRGDLPKAQENIEILKSLLPTNPRVFYNSALVYIALNNRAQALADLNEGLKHSKFDLETGKLIEELINKLQK